MSKQILVNRWMTPDGTVLQSKSVHDFVSYEDVDGNSYFVDGGLAPYQRTSGNMTNLCLYYGDKHEEIRKYFCWKSYGKDGKLPGTWITLQDMDTEHIEAILKTQHHIVGTAVELLFKDELEYRKVDNETN